MRIEHPKAILSRVRATIPGSWFWLLIGLGLVMYGQSLIEQRDLLVSANPQLDLWNITLRLELVNIQNLGAAFPYMLAGGILCLYTILPPAWRRENFSPEKEPVSTKFDWAYTLPRLSLIVVVFAYLLIQLGRHIYNPVMPWLWVFVLALSSLVIWHHEKNADLSFSPNLTRVDILWTLGLFFFGLTFGAFALRDIPNIMIPDEGSFWEAARAIATGEFKPAFFDFGVYTFPIASSIFQGWVLKLFGVNLWGWRFSSVLAGTAAVIPLYLLAREWFDRRVGVVTALIMLTNPYFLSFARLGYNNSQALLPAILALYFWSLGIKRGSLFYFWLAGIACGLGFYTYSAAWLGLVVILVSSPLFYLFQRKNVRQLLLVLAVFLTAWAVTVSPRLVFAGSSGTAEPLYFKLFETSFISSFYGKSLYGVAELYPNGIAYLIGKNEIFFAPLVYSELLARGFIRTLAALVDPFIISEHFMTTGLAGGYLPAVFFTLGLSLSLRGVKQVRFSLLLVWLATGLFFLSIIAAFPPRHTHLVTIIPALALLSALGLVALFDTLFEHLGNHKTWIPAYWLKNGLLFCIVSITAWFGLRQYFLFMPERNPPLFEDIVTWIAWRTDEPLNFAYVGPTDVPHKIEYQVDKKLVPHTYLEYDRENFLWEKITDPSIVFVEQTENGILTVPPATAEFTSFAIYTAQTGQPVGYAWANTPVDLQPVLPTEMLITHFQASYLLVIFVIVTLIAVMVFLRGRITVQKTESGPPGIRIQVEVRFRRAGRMSSDRESEKL